MPPVFVVEGAESNVHDCVRLVLSKIWSFFLYYISEHVVCVRACVCVHTVFTQSSAEMKTLLVGGDAHQLFDQ